MNSQVREVGRIEETRNLCRLADNATIHSDSNRASSITTRFSNHSFVLSAASFQVRRFTRHTNKTIKLSVAR